MNNNSISYPQIEKLLARCFRRCCHSGLPHLFYPLDTKGWKCSSCLWNSHSNGKGRILPQGTTSANKYSRIVILRDREREKETQWERRRRRIQAWRIHGWKGKEEREKTAGREQVQSEEIGQKEYAEFCCVFCPCGFSDPHTSLHIQK